MNTKTKIISVFNQIPLPLLLMMFMQYLLLAVWWVPLAAYLTNRGIDGLEKSLILSSMAIGSMASPLIGYMADRYFSSQKVLAGVNVLTAVFLFIAGCTNDTRWLFLFIFLAMFCYMPSWSLTSSIAMAHSQREQFPRIRMFGSFGWIASGLFSLVAIKIIGVAQFDGTRLPMICGSILAFVAALINLTLPDTPPVKSGKTSLAKIFGTEAFSMMKDRNYAIFMLCSFLAIMSFSLYYSFGSEFLQDRDFEFITITMNWGQAAELLFLFFTTAIIIKLGIKWAMIMGLLALIVRYSFFYWGVITDFPAHYITGILVHGLIFGLFFVGGQIYTDQRAPANLKAQAQGMLSFIIWGAGLLAGNLICGWLIRFYSSDVGGKIVYNWDMIFQWTVIFTILTLVVFALFFKSERR